MEERMFFKFLDWLDRWFASHEDGRGVPETPSLRRDLRNLGLLLIGVAVVIVGIGLIAHYARLTQP